MKEIEKLKELYRIMEEINQGKSFDQVFDLVYETLNSVISYSRIGIAILGEDGFSLVTRRVRSDREVFLKENYAESIKSSSLGNVIKKGEPRIINDLEEYSEQKPGSASTKLILAEGIRSNLTLPLFVKGKPIGVIFISSREKNNYSDQDTEYLSLIAEQLATCLEKGLLIENLEKTNKKLTDLNKLKDDFISIVSHDLRSPLISIIGFSRRLLDDRYGIFSPEIKEPIEIINRSGNHLMSLINDLLDLSKIEAGKVDITKTKGKLSQIFLESRHALSFNAEEKGIKVDVNPCESEPEISADWAKIIQVANNLLNNAIKFTQDGGRIFLSVKVFDDRNIEGIVRDTGQGIKDVEISKLFHKFSQTSSTPTRGEKGSGLGLAIVKNIIELHGGRVWVQSEWGKGSSFHFTLPKGLNENPN